MRRITLLSAIIGSGLVLMAGCTNSSSQEQKAYTPHIDPAEFTTKVDNEYFPLEPGTTFVAQRDDRHSLHQEGNGCGVRGGR
jgi:hypothetical protein